MQTVLDKLLVAFDFQDKQLTCSDCTEQFLFSVSEQAFYKEKNLKNEPRRCPNCRIISRLRRDGIDPTQTAEVCCVDCSAVTRVPFLPRGHKPIYCPTCLHARKKAAKDTDERSEEA